MIDGITRMVPSEIFTVAGELAALRQKIGRHASEDVANMTITLPTGDLKELLLAVDRTVAQVIVMLDN